MSDQVADAAAGAAGSGDLAAGAAPAVSLAAAAESGGPEPESTGPAAVAEAMGPDGLAEAEEPAAVAEGPPGVAEARRAQMLRAALDVISERGFADTRIADIADRIGISPALVIYYFHTKDQLLTEAIRYYEDAWYAEGKRRMAVLPTAAQQLEEFVAMNLLPEANPELESDWQLWLDFWVQAARNADVASVRRKSDERWREVIVTLVVAGQEAGEFAGIDPGPFAIFLSALLDGLTVQIALDDPVVDPVSAFGLCMRYIADHLGFPWTAAGRDQMSAPEITSAER